VYDAFRRTHLRIDSLLYGVILAAIYVFYPETFRKFAAHKTMLVASAVLLCVFMVLTVNSPVIDRDLGYTVQGIGFALLVVLVYTGSESAVTRLWYRAIARIGVYSYGIYLSHLPILWFAVAGMGDRPVVLRAIVCVALLAAVPVLLYYTIEDPFIRLGAELARGRSAKRDTVFAASSDNITTETQTISAISK